MLSGKPGLSSSYSPAVPPTPTAPAVAVMSDPQRRKDEGVAHPLADRPNRKGDALIDRSLPSTPEHPVPDYGSYTSKPATASDVTRSISSNLENVTHPLPDPPRHIGLLQSKL
nr:uncharacterized protein LOC127311906 [Lolium perenne]